jgi:hypothetical protein
MAQQLINIGASVNDKRGDPLRTAFDKVNQNFTELFTTDTITKYHLGDDLQFVDIDPESGTVVIQSGFDTGMPVYIKGANCSDEGVGGNVIIEAGGAPLPNNGTTGNIELAAQQTTIDSNNNLWTFRDDGVLELPEGGDIVDSNGDTVLGGTGGSGDSLVNGDSSFSISTDGTLTLTHPDEPNFHPLETQLIIQKAAGNYHTISGAYGLSLQATPVPSGYGLNTNTNFVDIFHDGISVNVNDNTWGFGTDGGLTFPDALSIKDSVIGKTGTNTITEGEASQTTAIESQIEITATGVVIAKRTSVTVNDGVITVVNNNGSTLELDNTHAALKYYQEPEGPDNNQYIQFTTDSNAGGGATIEIVTEDVGGIAYGRVRAAGDSVFVSAKTFLGTDQTWRFNNAGNLQLPDGGNIISAGIDYIETAYLETSYNEAEILYQDALTAWMTQETFKPVWFALPGRLAYDEMMAWIPTVGQPSLPLNLPPLAKDAQDTYAGWQATVALSKLTLASGTAEFDFNSTGKLKLSQGGTVGGGDHAAIAAALITMEADEAAWQTLITAEGTDLNVRPWTFAGPSRTEKLATLNAMRQAQIFSHGPEELDWLAISNAWYNEVRSWLLLPTNMTGYDIWKKLTTSVAITAEDNTWSFTNDGQLTLPNGLLGDANGGPLLSSNADKPVTIWTDNGMNSWEFGADGILRIQSYGEIAVEGDLGLRIGSFATTVAPNSQIKIGGADHAFEIFGGPPGYSWQFGTDGKLTIPGDITTPITPQVGTIVYNLPDYDSDLGSNQYVWVQSGLDAVPVYELISAIGDMTGCIFTNELGVEYTVIQDYSPSSTGGLTLEFDSAIPSGHTYTVRSPDYVAKIVPALNVNVDENLWTFSADGSLTLPGNSELSYNETTNTETISAPTAKQVNIATYFYGNTEGGMSGVTSISVLATEESRKIIPGWTIDFNNSNDVFVVTSVDEIPEGGEVRRLINFQQDVGGLDAPIVATGPEGTLELTAGGNDWTFGDDGLLTFPGANGFRATFGSVEPVGDVLHSVNSLYLESELTVGLTSGTQVDDLETAYNDQLTNLTSLLSAELYGTSFLPASHDSIIALAAAKALNPLISDQIITVAIAVSDAWDAWQSARTSAGVLINVADKQWVFGVAGDLRVPGTISKTNILQLNSSGTGDGAGNTASVSIDGNNGRLLVRTGDSETNKDWTFGNDGVLTLPQGPYGYSIVQSTGGLSLDSFQFGDAGDNVLSLPARPGLSYAQINAGTGLVQQQFLFGLDGSLTLPNGTAISDITDIAPLIMTQSGPPVNDGLTAHFIDSGASPNKFSQLVYAGLLVNGPGVTNGIVSSVDAAGLTLTITGGVFQTDASYVLTSPSLGSKLTVNSKDWKFGTDGNLTLPTGGEIKTAAGAGDVTIEANNGTARTWTFGGDGSVTFPDTTVQTTAYKQTTGSWTVAEGSDTYSFTVPTNGTYTMWVKGSIDNGIIVWNATASVSNTNVPVIGQQYAWNYTGGGTPIEFTAIPTQFIGTANNIVSSNPSVGTTSNKFDFVINNTSGSAQTVYWGYVAQ